MVLSLASSIGAHLVAFWGLLSRQDSLARTVVSGLYVFDTNSIVNGMDSVDLGLVATGKDDHVSIVHAEMANTLANLFSAQHGNWTIVDVGLCIALCLVWLRRVVDMWGLVWDGCISA